MPLELYYIDNMQEHAETEGKRQNHEPKAAPGILFRIGFVVFIIAILILYVIFPTLQYIGVFHFAR